MSWKVMGGAALGQGEGEEGPRAFCFSGRSGAWGKRGHEAGGVEGSTESSCYTTEARQALWEVRREPTGGSEARK